MNLSVMDNRVLVQKRNKHNDGMHHNTVTQGTFESICQSPTINYEDVKKFVYDNFTERYSDKWQLSKRNFKNTVFADKQDIIKEYNLDPNKKQPFFYTFLFRREYV